MGKCRRIARQTQATQLDPLARRGAARVLPVLCLGQSSGTSPCRLPTERGAEEGSARCSPLPCVSLPLLQAFFSSRQDFGCEHGTQGVRTTGAGHLTAPLHAYNLDKA